VKWRGEGFQDRKCLPRRNDDRFVIGLRARLDVQYPHDAQLDYFRIADNPGVGSGSQDAVTLHHFVRLAEILEISASLIR
jgi:hypothetical protein